MRVVGHKQGNLPMPDALVKSATIACHQAHSEFKADGQIRGRAGIGGGFAADPA